MNEKRQAERLFSQSQFDDLFVKYKDGFFIIELISLNSIICFVSAINNLDKFGSVYGVWFIDSLGRL